MNLKKLAILWPTGVIIILDQISKYWVRAEMPLWKSYSVIGSEFFRLTHVENTGVAFGFRIGSPIFLITFNLIASAFLLYFIFKPERLGPSSHPAMLQFALSMILGGAIGNLIDRILFRHVTDFLDFDFPNFLMTRWPTFNIADSAVTVGVCIWALHILLDARSQSHSSPAAKSEAISLDVNK
ncbi:MAG: signal peptidase II [bacterium]|nr:signal peptidase II [bacterium]